MTKPETEFMSIDQFRVPRSLPRSTFYKEAKAGRIRVKKRGRRTLIHYLEAERYDAALRDGLGTPIIKRESANDALRRIIREELVEFFKARIAPLDAMAVRREAAEGAVSLTLPRDLNFVK